MEQANLQNIIDFRFNYSDLTNAPQHAEVTRMKIPNYICPSETKAEPRVTTTLTHFRPTMALIMEVGLSSMAQHVIRAMGPLSLINA